MTIDEAVNLLTVKHLENKVKKWIRDPVAYTLYEVWQIADSKVTYHPSNLQRTCNHVATNADRIRAMSDEELAEFIGGIYTLERDAWGEYDPCVVVEQSVKIRDKDDMLNWLRSPAGGEK